MRYSHFLAGCPSFSYSAKNANGETQANSSNIAGPLPREVRTIKNSGTPMLAPAMMCKICEPVIPKANLLLILFRSLGTFTYAI